MAKSLGEDEHRHGSVSFQLEHYFGVGSAESVPGQRYKQWVTLFDHPDDDVYDGILGEDDDEVPRVLLEFVVDDGQSRPIVPPLQNLPVASDMALPKIAKQGSMPQQQAGHPTPLARGSLKGKPGAATPSTVMTASFNNRPNSGRGTTVAAAASNVNNGSSSNRVHFSSKFELFHIAI